MHNKQCDLLSVRVYMYIVHTVDRNVQYDKQLNVGK